MEQELEDVKAEIASNDNKMFVLRSQRSSYIDDIVSSTDNINSSLESFEARIMMKVNSLKAIINKFDAEDHVPDKDDVE